MKVSVETPWHKQTIDLDNCGSYKDAAMQLEHRYREECTKVKIEAFTDYWVEVDDILRAWEMQALQKEMSKGGWRTFAIAMRQIGFWYGGRPSTESLVESFEEAYIECLVSKQAQAEWAGARALAEGVPKNMVKWMKLEEYAQEMLLAYRVAVDPCGAVYLFAGDWSW